MGLPERKIVLLGKTGDGKSSAGNTIFGERVFTPKASASSSGAKCQEAEREVHGRKLTVIDTPGYFDTARDDETLKSEIIKALIECAPGVHAFVIVLKVGRYTRHEKEVVQKILNTFNEEHVLKHTVILFTHGEQLEGQTIEEFIRDCSQLQELVNKCGGRCHVIDNKYWNGRDSGSESNRVQVKNLLDTIDEMVKENGCYTNELLQKIEEDIQEEMKKTTKDNLHSEEKREKAKKTVHASYLVKFAGAATRAVIGALFGVAAAVVSAVFVLKSFDQLKSVFTILRGAAPGTIAAGVLGAGGLAGAAAGGFNGWHAAEEAESVPDAIAKAATDTFEKGLYLIQKTKEMFEPNKK